MTITKLYDKLYKNCGKEIFIMQIVNVRAYWHMGHAWMVKLFVHLSFVCPYKIMLSVKTVWSVFINITRFTKAAYRICGKWLFLLSNLISSIIVFAICCIFLYFRNISMITHNNQIVFEQFLRYFVLIYLTMHFLLRD